MQKLAIFVEGKTEALFIDKFITEVAGQHNVVVERRTIRGGTTGPRLMTVVQAARETTTEKFYVLIMDCGGDEGVKARVVEEHQGLSDKGFKKIIAMRDVRPNFTRANIAKLERGLRTRIKTSLIPVEFILATMEIEAWFLAEHTHFSRIDITLTPEKIAEKLGFNPETDDMVMRETPADDLNACYQLVGRSYKKGGDPLTLNSLSFEDIYINLAQRIDQLNKLRASVDEFMAA